MKEEMRDTGTTTITMSAFRTLCRKNRITRETRSTAKRRSVSTDLMALLVKVVVSCAISILSPSGAYCFSSHSICLLTALLTSMALASDCFRILIRMASCPLTLPIFTGSLVLSDTSATSSKRIMAPLVERITILRSSSTEVILPDSRTAI